MEGGQGRAGILVSQVPREQTVRVGFSVICGYSVTPEKQALGLLKKEVLSILKTIPLCNSTSVETLKGQIVWKKKKVPKIRYTQGKETRRQRL